MSNGYTGKLYPNGEFGISRLRRTGTTGALQTKLSERQKWVSQCVRVHGVFETIRYTSGTDSSLLSVAMHEESQAVDPFGLSPRANSHRAKRGSKGITGRGRKMVRNGAYLLEKQFGIQHLSFLTLTLPDLKGGQWNQLVNGWSEIVRVFLNWLKRRLTGCGLPGLIVSVTELQELRVTQDGVPALHLHMLFVGRKRKQSWAIKPQEFRESWLRAIGTQVEKLEECENKESCENVERVKKSAEKYLGKYMSKGLKAVQQNAEKLSEYGFPSTWWNATHDMKRWVKRCIKQLPSEVAQWLQYLVMERDKTMFLYSMTAQIQTTMNFTLTVGSSGKIAPSILPALMRHIQNVQAQGVTNALR